MVLPLKMKTNMTDRGRRCSDSIHSIKCSVKLSEYFYLEWKGLYMLWNMWSKIGRYLLYSETEFVIMHMVKKG